MPLRPYQIEAIDSIERVLAEGDSALAVMATGTGKTFTAAELVRRVRQRTGRVLWLAHRGELLEQAATTLRAVGLSAEIEMGEHRVSPLLMPDVVCASIQTLQGRRLQQFDPGAFGLIVVDEAHHARATSWMAPLDHFKGAKRLGLTATPDRSDRKALGQVFARVAYSYDIRDAIRDGYLAPLRAKQVDVDGLDLSEVSKKTGDFSADELEAILTGERELHEVAAPTLELAGDRPTLVFGVTVDHAKKLCDVLNRYRQGCAKSVDGTMDVDQRRKLLDEFRGGAFQFLTNVALLTEGVDLPFVSCVAMARPTLSRSLYTQMVGRGTRLHPGKTDALVIDFVGNAGRHSLISVLDILGGEESEGVKKRALAKVRAGDEGDLMTLIDQARGEEQRAAAAARTKAQSKFRARDVDLFSSTEQLLGIEVRRQAEVADPPSPEQVEKLVRHGIPVDGLDFWEAKKLTRAIAERVKANLCTLKQARILARHGLRSDVSFKDASLAIDEIAKSGWKAPPWLAADKRFAPEVAT